MSTIQTSQVTRSPSARHGGGTYPLLSPMIGLCLRPIYKLPLSLLHACQPSHQHRTRVNSTAEPGTMAHHVLWIRPSKHQRLYVNQLLLWEAANPPNVKTERLGSIHLHLSLCLHTRSGIHTKIYSTHSHAGSHLALNTTRNTELNIQTRRVRQRKANITTTTI